MIWKLTPLVFAAFAPAFPKDINPTPVWKYCNHAHATASPSTFECPGACGQPYCPTWNTALGLEPGRCEISETESTCIENYGFVQITAFTYKCRSRYDWENCPQGLELRCAWGLVAGPGQLTSVIDCQ